MKNSFSIPRIACAAYGFALLVIFLDQLTKVAVTDMAGMAAIPDIPVGYHFASVIPGVLDFTMVQNKGVSFGLFGGGEGRWLLSAFAVLVAGGLAWWATRIDRRLLISAVGLIIGGALGNAIDRIRFGFVVDFVDFSQTGLFPWVFNVADAAINVGVALLILDAVLSERRAKVGVAHEKS
ncbi:signal peptidase II [Brevundimonas sp. VNH65]|uniref:signal peptidase II n=1 Tax=Brevundimonas sp. VNH65 TaxID=3400917 RepID=UPI003C0EA8B6